nr:hypothetical protein [Halovulum marinum]
MRYADLPAPTCPSGPVRPIIGGCMYPVCRAITCGVSRSGSTVIITGVTSMPRRSSRSVAAALRATSNGRMSGQKV